MKQIFKISLTVAATALGVGFAFSSARADLISGPAVPEPTTMLLLGTGLVGAAAVVRRRLKIRDRSPK